ncbi:MAG: response regulator [Kiloniellales bacterium]|nr:response regulator [Kiloniellales bacterium]
MQVLFVDDDRNVSEAVSRALQRRGHQCRCVGLGEQAVPLAESQQFDIVVLDLGLPDIGGLEVLDRIRSQGITTPVLLQSGLPDDQLPDAGVALGGDDFLLKPFSIDRLLERMESTIKKRGNCVPQKVVSNGTPEWEGDKEATERRRHDRKDIFAAAVITDSGRHLPCAIRNISKSGALLRLSGPAVECPEIFTLFQLEGPKRRCRLRWRSEARIGVEFIEDEDD